MLFPLFQWCENTAIGEAIRSSTWLFPVIESFHLLAFTAIGGAVLMVDLRLLGWALSRERVSDVAAEAQPWLNVSLIVMIVSGALLFVSESVKCYYSNPFWIKMECLAAAIAFTWTVQRRAIAAVDAARISVVWGKVVALISFGLWAGVAWGGRWIGFS